MTTEIAELVSMTQVGRHELVRALNGGRPLPRRLVYHAVERGWQGARLETFTVGTLRLTTRSMIRRWAAAVRRARREGRAKRRPGAPAAC